NFYKNVRFWRDLGIPGPEPKFLIGNMIPFFQKNRALIDLEWTQKYGKIYAFHGALANRTTLMITDVELVKQVTTKDFAHFINRSYIPAYHELWNENMLNAEAAQWKKLRSLISPTFSSAKLRGMNKLMTHCIDKLTLYLDSVVAEGDTITDTKKVIGGFTIDVIASTSFGTETNANGMLKTVFIACFLKVFFRATIAFTFPRWMLNILGIRTFFDEAPLEFFGNLTREMLKQRKESKVKRNDFIQLLLDSEVDEQQINSVNYDKLTIDNDQPDQQSIDAKNVSLSSSKKKTLSEVEIVAQCILFLIGGYETTSSTLSHALYLLAKNNEFQERLHDEIVEALEGLKENSEKYIDKLLNNIPLLEATIKEVLRLYPPISVIFRRSTTDNYDLGGYIIPKGTNVEMSSYAIHRNPENYTDPDAFNPKRFLPENAHLLKPYTYLPFGAGPKNCLGMRFAYQEIKLCLVKLICRYRFSNTSKTPEELTFSKGSPLLVTETFPVGIAKR
ncbi:Cytochrome P450 3A4, partial [Tyrophagus putrescentiae]